MLFSAIIRFVHTGELDPEFSYNMSKLIELFRLAKSYGIKSLKNLCFAKFKEFLQPENIWKALKKSFEVKELRICCEELLATRTIECLRPKTFNLYVPIYLLKHILNMEKLNIPSEYLLVETMLRMNERCRSEGPFNIALPYLRLLTLNEAQLEMIKDLLKDEEYNGIREWCMDRRLVKLPKRICTIKHQRERH
ncbi:Hypothetical predicted protein [Cloeon dipterum]|uniref:BACK domain-containing protein n=1 Tax=Cloeon dipterum TaxID=197152 RepID=A0A8S1C4N0_9INSE|nr:Hypothetical predicted protein [Cloeon dipterum]